jgi:hypothetical protein
MFARFLPSHTSFIQPGSSASAGAP